MSVRCGPKYWIGSTQNTSAVTRCKSDGTWTIHPTCKSKKSKQAIEEEHWSSLLYLMCKSVTLSGVFHVFSLILVVFCDTRQPTGVSWWDIWQTQQVRMGDKIQYYCHSHYQSTSRSGLAECTRSGWRPDPLCQGTGKSICLSPQ